MIPTGRFAPILLVLIAVGSTVPLTARQPAAPAAQQPIFRAKADLVAVDASVVDGKGQPVPDLRPDEFTLTVDGKPRRLVSVEYVARTGAAAVRGTPGTDRYTSNQGSTPGRLITIVVDQGNIRTGGGRATLRAVSGFLDKLSPADRVSLAVIPAPGPRVEFTANRNSIREALTRVVGGQQSRFRGGFNIGIAEARAFQDGDRFTWQAVVGRECRPSDQACAEQLASEAIALISEVHHQADASLAALAELIRNLGRIEAPKTLVLISEGLTINGTGTLSWVAAATAAARVSIYALHLDSGAFAFDASEMRPSPSANADAALQAEGLETLTGFARGTLFRVTGAGEFAFDRIAAEISGYYLLSFEPAPTDRDGKTHKIRVEIARKGLTLRARREFAIREQTAAAPDIQDRLAHLLQAPFPETDISLKVATFTLQDQRSSRLRVIISAQIDTGPIATPVLTLGFLLTDGAGRIANDAFQRATLTARDGGALGARPYVGSVLVDPGAYTLKFAAVEAGGRGGSVEHTVDARLTPAGDLKLGDLILSDEVPRPGESPRPSLDLEPNVEAIGTYLEVYGSKPADLKGASVNLEVAQNESAPALVSGTMQLAGRDTRRASRGVISIGLLPPGEYVARAVLSIEGQPVGRAVRTFVIPPRATAAVATKGPNAARPAALAAMEDRGHVNFRKEAVLDAGVLGTFLDRLKARTGPAMSSPVSGAIEQARGGRFDALPAKLPAEHPGEKLAATFLQGLRLLASGDLENAAGQFRAALTIESDFFPALFYLGACYAAGGRDTEAAAAWQTSLITETESPIIYRVLSEALLRQNDAEQAVSVLREATEVWPHDVDFARQLAHAYAGTGQRKEAVGLLTPLIDKQPDDKDALFLAMRVIYEAFAAGDAIVSPADDLARLTKYSQQYATVNGPQQDLVAQWVRVMTQP